jgi:hypothetical protein
LRDLVLLVFGKIVVVIFVHRGMGPALFRGRSCAGARSNTQQPASARLSQQLRRFVTHRAYCDCTFRSSYNWLLPLCSINLTTFSQERRGHPNKHTYYHVSWVVPLTPFFP